MSKRQMLLTGFLVWFVVASVPVASWAQASLGDSSQSVRSVLNSVVPMQVGRPTSPFVIQPGTGQLVFQNDGRRPILFLPPGIRPPCGRPGLRPCPPLFTPASHR